MLSFIGRSIIQKIVTLFFVSIVSFLILYLAPGKPSQVDPLNPKFTPEIVERFRKAFSELEADEAALVKKALRLLAENLRHPSLKVKK